MLGLVRRLFIVFASSFNGSIGLKASVFYENLFDIYGMFCTGQATKREKLEATYETVSSYNGQFDLISEYCANCMERCYALQHSSTSKVRHLSVNKHTVKRSKVLLLYGSLFNNAPL